MTAPPSRRPRRGQAHAALEPLDEPACDEALERRRVDDLARRLDGERLVEPQPEHQALDVACRRIEPLELVGRPVAAPERCHVAPHRREVPSPHGAERRDRAHADAEVVGTAPDGQVVPSAEIAAAVGYGSSSPSRTSGTRRRSASPTTRSA